MAFCKFCGTQLSDDAIFCPNCGKQKGAPAINQPSSPNTQLNNQDIQASIQGNAYQEIPYQGNVSQPQQFIPNMPYQAAPVQKKKGKLPFVVVGLIVAVVLFFIVKNAGIGSGNYETPIKYFCEAMSEVSISKLYKALPPAFEEYVSSALGIFGLNDTELLNNLGLLSDAGMSISYDIISKEPLTRDELEEYSDNLSSSYLKQMEVKSGYMLYIRFVVDGEEDYEYVPVGKIDGRWCIIEDIF